MAEEKKKCSRNILNAETGFHVIVNFYIMRYIYSHMKNKANGLKNESFYEIVGIAKQTINRIWHGENFEMTYSAVDSLVCKFGLEREYFDKAGRANGHGGVIKEGKFIEIKSLTVDDWRYFFEKQYEEVGFSENDKELLSDGEKWKEERLKQEKRERNKNDKRIKHVKKQLSKLFGDNAIEREYLKSSAVYKVYFFYKYGTPFIEETPLVKLKDAIFPLKLSDWAEIEDDLVEMEKYKTILQKHLDYLRIVTDYKKTKEQLEKE